MSEGYYISKKTDDICDDVCGQEMEDGEYLFSHLRDNSLDDNSLDDLREMLHQYTFSSEEDTVGFGLNNNVVNGNSSISHESIALRHAKTATLSFEDSTVVVTAATVPNCGRSGGGSCTNESRKRRSCNSGSTMDHIIAERRRRQELSQRFIALSAIVPGLNKIDKISILKEATTYVKQLQTRVKELEEQSAKMIIESPPSFINNNNYFYSGEGIVPYKKNSSDCHDELNNELNNVALPKLEARVMEKEVLIRIHCEKKNYDILLKALSHIKSLHFSIVNHGVLPFGKFSLAIAIVARMGDNCSITVKDLVKSLRQALFESLPECQTCFRNGKCHE